MVVEGGGDLSRPVADTEGCFDNPERSSAAVTSSESQDAIGNALPTTLMQESNQPLTATADELPVVPEGGGDTVNASAHVQYRLHEYRFTRTCVVCQYTVCTDQCVY